MQIAKFRLFRDRIHEGPLYTVLGDDARVGKHQSWAAASSDPFEGMPTYSQKYARKRRRVPKLDTRPYVSTFFPKELWSILDPTRATANGVEATPKTKKLQISTSNKTTGLSAYDREMTNEPEATKSTADRGANGDVEDDEADDRDGDEEAPPEEEEMDDDYDDDEDDMGGDYNAEQYFDDGGDQMGDDYDGGDSGEGEY
ncbi:hypothetical protein MMC09_003893 [Bachmanniomyces sp. S44760]|nr:hypothetical protein [Bachmanniomyces sp. S44760]